jgi:Amt family ammonium transporter
MLTFVCTIGILLIIPAMSVLYREFLDRTGVRTAAVLTLAICTSSFAAWLAISLFIPGVANSPLEFPTAALAALSGFLASLTVRDTTAHAIPALLFSVVWTMVVFAPIAVFVFFPANIGLNSIDGPLDLAGALPVHAAVGSGALVILTVARRWTVTDRSHVRPRSWALFASGVVIWIGWILGSVGLDLSVDSLVTPRIITNTIVAPVLGVIGWLIVQRIRSATTSPIGAVAGLVCGLVAISAGSAYFTPLWAGVTGAAAGIAGSLFVSGWVRATRRHAWFIVGAHLLSAVVGLLMLGLFGTGFGFIFDGQISLLEIEFVSAFFVVVWAGVVSLVLWLGVRAIALRQGVG